jgi:hypothetical protein
VAAGSLPARTERLFPVEEPNTAANRDRSASHEPSNDEFVTTEGFPVGSCRLRNSRKFSGPGQSTVGTRQAMRVAKGLPRHTKRYLLAMKPVTSPYSTWL